MSAANQLKQEVLIELEYPYILLEVPKSDKLVLSAEARAKAYLETGLKVVVSCEEYKERYLGKRVLVDATGQKAMPFPVKNLETGEKGEDDFYLFSADAIIAIFKD